MQMNYNENADSFKKFPEEYDTCHSNTANLKPGTQKARAPRYVYESQFDDYAL